MCAVQIRLHFILTCFISGWARFLSVMNTTRLVIVIVVRVDYARAHLRMMTNILGTQISGIYANSDLLEKY